MSRLAHLSISAVLLIVAAPLAAAAESLELYPTPKTDAARQVQSLFNATLAIAMVVFVGVEGLLFYILWRFRNNKTVPANETHRGHTTAEIAWTVIPAVILLGLGSVSAVTLFELDTVPEDYDFAVRVEASAFQWRYVYPDGNFSYNVLRVQSGETVRLDVVSRDVEHQLFIPNFAIKLSAIPGRTNHQWFIAPEPGDYHVECTMYCGFGHHDMGAAIPSNGLPPPIVQVFAPGMQPLPYGRAPVAAAS